MESKQRVSKACDACKLRKVKCNGKQRCQQCSHLGLHCVFSIPNKPRSQGKRGRVISEYRKCTANKVLKSHRVLLPTTTEGSKETEYGPSFFLDLLPDYRDAVYPTHPVITEDEVRTYIHAMEIDQEARSFVYAFGACTLNLSCCGERRTEEVVHTIDTLVKYSIENRGPSLPTLHASVQRAMHSVFLHNCLMSMPAPEAAFFYMRDAISTIELLRVDSVDTMAVLPPPERARRQRLYWQAFIHERFVAILDYRHAILHPLDHLPENDPTIPIAVQEGFNQIIKLFRLLDPEFLKNWLSSHGGSGITSTWIEAKSRELEGQDEENAEELAILSTMQRADLAITREWLRTLVWRLAMSQALLSSRSSKECLSLLFPVRLSQHLRQQVTSMSRKDIEVHGSCIVQKLFEITDTIADVLITVPATTLEETALRINDFVFILDFVLQFPTLDRTRRGILIEKLERLQTMFPEVYSNSNSPTVPTAYGRQSPPYDPWYHVAQSKILPESNFAYGNPATPMDADETQLQTPTTDVSFGQSPPRDDEQATWNAISRQLSMAHPVHA